MKMRMKRITGFFLSLVMVMGFLPLNPIVSYANDNASGDVKIDDKNFPDPTFRDYVSQNFDKSHHHDGKLSQNELDDVKKIGINNTSVTSLQGIEYFKNLDFLDCSRNKITSLDVSKNINLCMLDCSRNNLTSLKLGNNTNLRMLNCSGNQLTSLDLSGNTMPISLSCNNQQYNITVIKGIRKFKYSDFPGRFDKDKVKSLVGATLGDDALIVNDDNPSVVTYKYKVGDRNNQEMSVKLNVTYFDPDLVRDIKVKKQPTKRVYTDGENLDLTGLVVTLTDEHSATVDVPFSEFQTYGIKATPDNGTVLKLGHNGNPVKLTRGNLTATTSALKVKAKESIPTHVGGGSTSTSTSGSGSAGGSAGGFSAGMNYYAPTTVDKGELNIQIDSAESDSKPGYAGDGSGAAVKQAADRLGDALAQAKRVAANPNATQAQVGASARKLADARKAQHEKPDPKPHHEKPDSKSHHEKQAPKSQTKKRIGMIHKTDKSVSFAGLIAVLVGSIAVIGFSIAGFAILRRRK